MSCPKQRIVYPDTSRSFDVPYLTLVMRADPEFQRDKRRDLAYRFGEHRRFFCDTMTSGPYQPIVAADPVSGPTEEEIATAFRLANGFCD